MYLVSAYFDDRITTELEWLINRIAQNTKNDFMVKHQVPPHMTVASFEAGPVETLLEKFSETAKFLGQSKIEIVSPGALLPYVIYVTPVMSFELWEINRKINSFLEEYKDINIGKYYQPGRWLPHITLGKTLARNEMGIAFQTLQQYFVPMKGCITEIGIAKTNPHQDLLRIKLNENADEIF